jgi:hypothetical protein
MTTRYTKTGTALEVITHSEIQKKRECNYSKSDAKPKSRWQAASAQARMLVNLMRSVTPAGAAPPWRSGPSVEPIEAMLADGITPGEIQKHIESCAEVVKRGKQPARYWYPANLFGDRTMPHWQAEGAKLTASAEAAKANQRDLARLVDRLEETEFKEATPPELNGFRRDLEAMLVRGHKDEI